MTETAKAREKLENRTWARASRAGLPDIHRPLLVVGTAKVDQVAKYFTEHER
jgi:hypothetical protein